MGQGMFLQLAVENGGANARKSISTSPRRWPVQLRIIKYWMPTAQVAVDVLIDACPQHRRLVQIRQCRVLQTKSTAMACSGHQEWHTAADLYSNLPLALTCGTAGSKQGDIKPYEVAQGKHSQCVQTRSGGETGIDQHGMCQAAAVIQTLGKCETMPTSCQGSATDHFDIALNSY